MVWGGAPSNILSAKPPRDLGRGPNRSGPPPPPGYGIGRISNARWIALTEKPKEINMSLDFKA